eukprot:gene740-311_t
MVPFYAVLPRDSSNQRNTAINQRLAALGLRAGGISLPSFAHDADRMTKWAVIACDQYTSDRKFWEEAEEIVGKHPSTFNLMLPEVFLNDTKPEMERRRSSITLSMEDYSTGDVLAPAIDELVLVERTCMGRTRYGIMICVDLEAYDYNAGSTALVRASERTIQDRLPPRVEIRREAVYELPHVLVLVDDPDKTIVEPLVQKAKAGDFDTIYDFDLMKNGGHLKSWKVPDECLESFTQTLEDNYSKENFVKRYGEEAASKVPMLFAVGDGNHSLASAKAFWEQLKKQGADPETHPARYALVEINNIHDEGLVFEPIHRLLFDVPDMSAFLDHLVNFLNQEGSSASVVDSIPEGYEGHTVEIHYADQHKWLLVDKPIRVLAVATLQAAVDDYLSAFGNEADNKPEIDFIHGTEAIEQHIGKGDKASNIFLTVPGMAKSHLFKTVVFDGVLPRKTFSMGETDEKRHYCEVDYLFLFLTIHVKHNGTYLCSKFSVCVGLAFNLRLKRAIVRVSLHVLAASNFGIQCSCMVCFHSDGSGVESDAGSEVEVEVEIEEEITDVFTAVRKVLKNAMFQDGVVRGLHEVSKAIEAGRAQVVFLNEACDEGSYKKLIEALCEEKQIPIVNAPDAKQLGEWAGLCTVDAEGNPKKVVGASAVAVIDYGEESEALRFLSNHITNAHSTFEDRRGA